MLLYKFTCDFKGDLRSFDPKQICARIAGLQSTVRNTKIFAIFYENRTPIFGPKILHCKVFFDFLGIFAIKSPKFLIFYVFRRVPSPGKIKIYVSSGAKIIHIVGLKNLCLKVFTNFTKVQTFYKLFCQPKGLQKKIQKNLL